MLSLFLLIGEHAINKGNLTNKIISKLPHDYQAHMLTCAWGLGSYAYWKNRMKVRMHAPIGVWLEIEKSDFNFQTTQKDIDKSAFALILFEM